MTRTLFLILSFCCFLAPAAAQPKTFRAGAYAMDITPEKFPISVNGGMRDRQATGSHDTLHARCLVLDDTKTRIAIVVVDSCMVPRHVCDEAKRLAAKATGIAPDRILISATHAHSAPTLAGVFQSEPNEAYVEFLPKQIAKGIAKAAKNLEPAVIGWGVGKDPTQVFNRRWFMKPGVGLINPLGKVTDTVRMNPGIKNPGLIKPAGPIDPDVSFVSLKTSKGRPIAFLANYSLHYVGGAPALSADYFGAFAGRMAQLLDATKVKPAFVGIMSNGTSGDINNINFGGEPPGRREPFEQCRVVANSVAEAASKAHSEVKYSAWAPLAMAQKELTLGVRLPTAMEIQRARDILAKAKGTVLTKMEEVYARETVLISKFPKQVKLLVQAIRIGDLAIVTTPCETFVEIGLELKKKSPFKHTFTIELANGYNGYLPTPQQHKYGGYETWRARSSYLEENASVVITNTLLGMLKQMR